MATVTIPSVLPLTYPDIDPTWRAEVQNEHFYEDLQENLRVFEKSVTAELEIDLEFARILAQDLSLLHAHYQTEPSDLHVHRMEQLSSMNEGLQRVSSLIRPLVSAPTAPKDLIVTIDSSPQQRVCNEALTYLTDQGFRIRKVRGNGHCLFASIAAHLFTIERLEMLRKNIPELIGVGVLPIPQDPSSDPLVLIDFCIEELRKGVSVESLLQREDIYFRAVALLRHISTGYWRMRIEQDRKRGSTETSEELYQTISEVMPDLQSKVIDEACAIYLERMSGCDRGKTGVFGDPSVIIALERMLHIKIRVFDANVPTEAAERGIEGSRDPHEFFLLYGINHYDALYPVTEVV